MCFICNNAEKERKMFLGMQIADLRGKGMLPYGCGHKNVLDNKSNL